MRVNGVCACVSFGQNRAKKSVERTQSIESAAKKVAASKANVPKGLYTPTPTAKHFSPMRYSSLRAPEGFERGNDEGRGLLSAGARCAPMLTRCWRINAMTMRNMESSSRRTLLKRDCVANIVRCVRKEKEGNRQRETRAGVSQPRAITSPSCR